MSAGLFVSTCPDCGGELVSDHLGNSACSSCDRAYLNRFGHLFPVERVESEIAAPALPLGQG